MCNVLKHKVIFVLIQSEQRDKKNGEVASSTNPQFMDQIAINEQASDNLYLICYDGDAVCVY